MAQEIPKRYDPSVEEPKWQAFWEKYKIYKFDPAHKGEIFSIDTPPPTVSGKMHIGHAFSFSQQDFIARFQRMRGKNVFCPFGTDDNGLPTKLLVEKLKKVRAADMPRSEFVKLCLETAEKELRPEYIADWKQVGISCDFEMFYTTISEHSQKISQKSFIDLYNDGREYRMEAAAMHCPRCNTAISQVECEDKEIASHFNDIIFKADGKDLIIATTRPELLPACVAVFYHPDDKRYQYLEGKKAVVPLFEFEVPILADERADPEKGTGLVMCCTFGDATDVEWQKAHDLPIKEAIDRSGRMTELAEGCVGQKIEEARKGIIADLKEAALLVKQEPITHAVNVHERCGTPIEFVHSKQWFVKYLDLKEDMIQWGKELQWYPDHMRHRYENWVNGLQWDWCISRQLPFGVPFPVWYCEKCEEVILAEEKDLPVDPTEDKPPVDTCPKCGHDSFVPEEDIINTWATSSLTPQIAASLVPDMYDKLYPMTLRPQAHDIISFWLFNTVVKSQLHNGVNPWRDCIISGWALDPKGKKMSKSKGNVIVPQDMIKKYSADALRYWAATSRLGEDVPFQEKELVTAQKLMTKLWNAARFASMHLEDFDGKKPEKLEAMDAWVLAKLNQVISLATETFDRYEWCQAKAEAEQFFWKTLCDNYLEIIKDRLYNPGKYEKGARESAQYTLSTVFMAALKLFAPVMPFSTEAVYQYFFKENEADKTESIHQHSWPEIFDVASSYAAEGDRAVEVVAAVRRFKADRQQSLGAELSSLTITCTKAIEEKLQPYIADIKGAARAGELIFGKGGTEKVDENISITAGFVQK
jgi:valyl-tRNA synthetase